MAASPTHEVDPPSPAAKRVLVVDDEPALRELLCRALEHDGHTALGASDGSEALDIARKTGVDLVITDIWMPRMNGVELVEALSQMGCPAEVIVLSAHLTAASTEKLHSLGVFRVLDKPLDIGEFRDAVRRGLESDRRTRLSEDLASRGIPGPAERRATVLVADDDDNVREFLRTALASAGYFVEEARSGEEAIEKALACGVDLVLMDLNMPGMGGREAVKALRRDLRDCFVICITGEGSAREIAAALAGGATACFRKPFDLDALMTEVKRLDLISAHRRRRNRWEAIRRQAARAGSISGRLRVWLRCCRRRHRLRLRWLVAGAVVLMIVAAAAVPVLSAWSARGTRAAASAAETVGATMESLRRVEGYLERDEARELQRQP